MVIGQYAVICRMFFHLKMSVDHAGTDAVTMCLLKQHKHHAWCTVHRLHRAGLTHAVEGLHNYICADTVSAKPRP